MRTQIPFQASAGGGGGAAQRNESTLWTLGFLIYTDDRLAYAYKPSKVAIAAERQLQVAESVQHGQVGDGVIQTSPQCSCISGTVIKHPS